MTLAQAAIQEKMVFDYRSGRLANVLFVNDLPQGGQLALQYLDGSIAYLERSLLMQFEVIDLPHVPTREQNDIIESLESYQQNIPRENIFIDEDHLPSWWSRDHVEV